MRLVFGPALAAGALNRLPGNTSGGASARARQARRGCVVHPGEQHKVVAEHGHAVTVTARCHRPQRFSGRDTAEPFGSAVRSMIDTAFSTRTFRCQPGRPVPNGGSAAVKKSWHASTAGCSSGMLPALTSPRIFEVSMSGSRAVAGSGKSGRQDPHTHPARCRRFARDGAAKPRDHISPTTRTGKLIRAICRPFVGRRVSCPPDVGPAEFAGVFETHLGRDPVDRQCGLSDEPRRLFAAETVT
nr:hypothetical protein CPGR_03686 [Mycolicibacterium fortuitum subsp. fortuitum DSM 46621 = ATCC 6841 = JCM 6387]CRL80806.1 hypothetical protein CPGR_04020 [Mycolicibacter nonchromogenicus]